MPGGGGTIEGMVTLPELIPHPPTPTDLLRSASETAADTFPVAAVRRAVEALLTSPPSSPTGPGFVAGEVFYPVRTLTADDTGMLRRFLSDGLSDESRRTRFQTATPRVPKSAAEWLARRDGQERVALIALDPAHPDRIAGMAEYAYGPGWPDPEVAFAVADAFQRRGIATQLVRMLATLSVAGGHLVWRASMLVENQAALGTLETVGKVTARAVGAGLLDVRVEVDTARIFGAAV